MTDDVKRIDPLVGVFATLSSMKDVAMGGTVEGRDDVFRHDEPDGGFIVDTCAAFDTHEWETGIYPKADGKCVIVEQYPNREAAETGHAKWVESMTADPTQELNDIDIWGA